MESHASPPVIRKRFVVGVFLLTGGLIFLGWQASTSGTSIHGPKRVVAEVHADCARVYLVVDGRHWFSDYAPMPGHPAQVSGMFTQLGDHYAVFVVDGGQRVDLTPDLNNLACYVN